MKPAAAGCGEEEGDGGAAVLAAPGSSGLVRLGPEPRAAVSHPAARGGNPPRNETWVKKLFSPTAVSAVDPEEWH